ncbi:protein-L-isoaspartate O-methyltransferase [Liberibacter crescens]|nr:protein-L-isoaspartate(D-aspartate) O-methyltransferase [Liberibacter crescens]AMC13406.1 protein-L-isoaspartate O-methyltransferase [Liberibacter crescens]
MSDSFSKSEKENFFAMISRLKAQGIVDSTLFNAFEKTPRSIFAPPHFIDVVWSNRTIPIECGSFMEGADLAARMIHHLKVKAGHRVLEVGTGSGFTATVIAQIAERVFTIERYKTLVVAAQKRLEILSINSVIVRQYDGSRGMSIEGTFDRIFLTTAFPSLPRVYVDQLVPGGLMIIPLIFPNNECKVVRVTKTGHSLEQEELFQAPYLPITPKISLFL